MITQDFTEEQLVLDFKRGEEEAFTSIYTLFNKRLFLFATRYIQNTSEAEDILTEVFINLWKLRQQFDSMEYITVFLHRAVKNKCIDYVRRQQVRQSAHQKLQETIEMVEDGDFSTEVIKAEMIGMIYSEAEKLPKRMKEVFLLSYKDGLKPADIAKLLSLNVQTVKNQRVNAVILLKIAMNYKINLLIFLTLLFS